MRWIQCSVLLICISLMPYAEVLAGSCSTVKTSEGTVTLLHGQRACAGLEAGEKYDNDAGKRFITCNNGDALTQACSPGLRFDVKTSGCTWPQSATCKTSGGTGGPVGTDAPGAATTQATWTPAPVNSCDETKCVLPNCFCYGATPQNVTLPDMPMFIMLTFDDAITARFFERYYRNLLLDNIYNISNPTGCNIKSAFYVVDDNMDYAKLKILAHAGNEMASHTIHHILAQGDKESDRANISAEINGMVEKVFNHTGDASISKAIVGFRAPYLRVAGNIMYDVLRDGGFLYDTSIINVETSVGHDPLWPYTLDYPPKGCVNPPCPTKEYKGLWEVPLNGWTGDDGFSCSMIDACNVGQSIYTASQQDWYAYYQRNFNDYFYKKRIPMHMFTHASLFLRSPNSFPALTEWLHHVTTTNDNIWLVSPSQVISWMQNQMTNAEMIAEKWGC